MDGQKLFFISTQFTPLVNPLSAAATGKWGKMNTQQMTEHVAGFWRIKF